MKRYLLLALILAAGLSAYPQATRSARHSSSTSSSSRSAAVRSSKGSSSRSAAVKSSKNSASRSAVRSNSGSARKASSAVRSSRSRATQSKSSGGNKAVRSSQSRSTRSSGNTSGVRREAQVRSSSALRSSSNRRSTNNARGSAVRSATKSDNRSVNNRSGNRSSERIHTSSAVRSVKEGKDYLVTGDGRTIRHQNNEVFTHRKYNYNFRDRNELLRSHEYNMALRDYNDWHRRRHIRVIHRNFFFRPLSIDIRRVRYVYRRPRVVNIIWTPSLYNRFMFYYPGWDWDRRYYQDFGASVETISSYDASANIGLVKRVYGKVEEVYYSPEEENYILYFGAPFPYHDFSVVIPRNIAKNIALAPSWYFKDEYVWAVGLIEVWQDKPEMVIRDDDQIRRY